MSISQVLVILLRRGWIVALALLTTLIVAGSVLVLVPGRYDATATASIDPGNIDPITDASAAGSIGLMQGNIISLVTSQRVAVDVVKRLNLTGNPQVQESFRNSPSFGRESIEEWMAASVLRGVDPRFILGTNVLAIKYKSGDPNQAALIANAFLAATIDGTVAMKAAAADQTARWFAPQIEELRKDLDVARAALAAFQAQSNMVATGQGGDSETSQYMAISGQVSSATANLMTLQNRLASGSTDLSNDPCGSRSSVSGWLERENFELGIDDRGPQGHPRPENPKMAAELANHASVRKQLAVATDENVAASERAHRHGAIPDRFAPSRARQSAENSDQCPSAARPHG